MSLVIPNLLSVITFLPLAGALVILVLRAMSRKDDEAAIYTNAKWISLWTTLATLALSIIMLAGFDRTTTEYQFVEKIHWFGPLFYHMGVDGISILFVAQTAVEADFTGVHPVIDHAHAQEQRA